MSTAPALEIRDIRQDAWHLACAALAVLGIAAVMLWWFAQAAPRPVWVHAAALAAGSLALGCGSGWRGIRQAPTLRWDGQRWWMQHGGERAVPGSIAVALDLGDWMLLRFAPETRPGRWLPPRWAAVQRRGLEGVWHALRCTVHAATAHEATAV